MHLEFEHKIATPGGVTDLLTFLNFNDSLSQLLFSLFFSSFFLSFFIITAYNLMCGKSCALVYLYIIACGKSCASVYL